jgi:hypothetical protein
MHNLATTKIWQTAFGKDFGRMAQGNLKTGQKGTNSIFVMTHAEIPGISKIKRLLLTPVLLWTTALSSRTLTTFVSRPAETSLTILVSS